MTRNYSDYLARRARHTTWRGVDEQAPVRLKLGELGSLGRLEIRGDVPETRGDCPTQRPCPHVRCEWHLWLRKGEDRPGRRIAGRAPPTTLRPVWMRTPIPPSCGADLADEYHARGEPMPIDLVARLNGIRPSRAHEILATATAKLKLAGIDLRKLMLED